MKKILFLLLICFIKLNAYEYLVGERKQNLNPTYTQFVFFLDENNQCKLKLVRVNGSFVYSTTGYNVLYFIKTGDAQTTGGIQFISKSEFEEIYKNDLIFLNGLYSDFTNAFLNYLYNDFSFGDSNYINYDDYELLYNSDGLAVESIVNGQWAGFYEDSGQSGYLYNKKGELLYVNGEPSTFFDKICEKLLKRFNINLQSIFIKKIFYPLLVFIFACVVLRSVIRLAIQAFLIRFYDKKISQLEKRREKIENA